MQKPIEYLGVPTLIHVEGVPPYHLNADLARRRRLTVEAFETIRGLHLVKCQILLEMMGTDDPARLHQLAESFEENQFLLQDAWGFPRNRDFHPWYTVPKCTCPKIDNKDREGLPYRVMFDSCPVHGQGSKKG